MRFPLSLIVAGGILAALPAMAQEDFAEQVKQPVRKAISTRIKTQKSVEAWADEREKLLGQLERLQKKNEWLKSRKADLAESVALTEKRVSSKKAQLADMKKMSSELQPMLDEILVWIEELKERDLPFLTAERSQRIVRLHGLMKDPEVPVNERFRKVMEALQVEAEYGNTIETYQETIEVGGESLLVNVFRLGRVSLFYQSLDSTQCGYFNLAEHKWQGLEAGHNRAIQTAINIGAKRQPVELVNLPLGRMAVK